MVTCLPIHLLGAKGQQPFHRSVQSAKETSRTNQGRSATSASRMDDSRMTAAGQSLTDPSRLMGRRGTRHPTRFISQQIIHVDPVSNKSSPVNYCKQFLSFGTWNVLSLVSSSSQLYQLSQNIDQYSLDLLGITETHMPGSGTTLLDNGSLLIHSGRADGIKRQGVGLSLSKRIKNSLISFTPTSEQ